MAVVGGRGGGRKKSLKKVKKFLRRGKICPSGEKMELGFSNKSKVGVKARMTTKMTTMTPKIQTIVFRKCMTLYLKKTFTFEDYKTKYDEKGDDETEEEYHNRCVEIWNNLCDDVKPDKHGEVQFEDDDDDDDEIENEYQDAYFNRIENVVEEHIEKAQEEYEEYNADPLDDDE